MPTTVTVHDDSKGPSKAFGKETKMGGTRVRQEATTIIVAASEITNKENRDSTGHYN